MMSQDKHEDALKDIGMKRRALCKLPDQDWPPVGLCSQEVDNAEQENQLHDPFDCQLPTAARRLVQSAVGFHTRHFPVPCDSLSNTVAPKMHADMQGY